MCKRAGKMRRNCRPRYSKTVSVRCHGNDDGSRGCRVTGWLLCSSESLLSVWHWNCISRKSSFIKTHRPLTWRHEFHPYKLLLKSLDAAFCIENAFSFFPKKTAFHLLDPFWRLYLQTFQDFESRETSFLVSPIVLILPGPGPLRSFFFLGLALHFVVNPAWRLVSSAPSS